MVLHIARERARGFTLESLGLHGEAMERVHACLLHRRGLLPLHKRVGTRFLLVRLADAEVALTHRRRRGRPRKQVPA